MSFGSTPDVPKVSDPNVVANNQQDLNRQMFEDVQAASNVNQATPTGSLTYTQSGVGPNGVPTYTATQSLSPEEQALLSQMQGLQRQTGNTASSILSGGNYGSNVNPLAGVGDATSGATKALLGQETSYLDPYFQHQTSTLDAKLQNQGIFPGSPAYKDAMMQNTDTQNRAITNFLTTAEPNAFQQSYQTAMGNYQLPLSTAESLMGLSAPSGLGLTTTPQASGQPADLIGATSSANSANMAAYQAQLQQQNAMMSGLFGLGSAGISGGTGGFGNSMLGSLMKAAPFAAIGL